MSEANQEALHEALVKKLAEAVMGRIGAKVDERLDGIAKKNSELLGELVKQKDHSSDLAAQLAEAEKGNFDPAKAPVQIRKTDARSVSKYRAAKAEAADRGVPLEIVADD